MCTAVLRRIFQRRKSALRLDTNSDTNSTVFSVHHFQGQAKKKRKKQLTTKAVDTFYSKAIRILRNIQQASEGQYIGGGVKYGRQGKSEVWGSTNASRALPKKEY